MDFRKKSKISTEFSTASMSDLVFLLLIFFMITSTLVSPNAIKIILPKATQQTISKQSCVVALREDLSLYINNKPTTLDRLPLEIETVLKGIDKPAVSINADKSVPYEEVVKIISIANKLKVGIVLATSPE